MDRPLIVLLKEKIRKTNKETDKRTTDIQCVSGIRVLVIHCCIIKNVFLLTLLLMGCFFTLFSEGLGIGGGG